jgi:hypothetical protein
MTIYECLIEVYEQMTVQIVFIFAHLCVLRRNIRKIIIGFIFRIIEYVFDTLYFYFFKYQFIKKGHFTMCATTIGPSISVRRI